MPQKYVNVNGAATLVHHRGPTTLPGLPPDTSQGEAVLCLHDAGSNGKQFNALMDALAAEHSPMAYDQPGHGRSASLDALSSIGAMAEHLETMAATWQIENPILVGEGLGIAVALEAARRRPDWARALVLVGGAADHWDLDSEIASLAAITSGKARREFDRTGYAPDTDKSVYQAAFANWVTTDPRATLGARRAQADWTLSQPPPTPTLVVVGEHEEEASAAAAAALAARLEAATVERLAGAGLRGVLEQPEALAATVAEFISNIDSASSEVGGRS